MPLIMPLFCRYIAVNPSHLYVGMAKALEKSIFGPWKKHNFDDPISLPLSRSRGGTRATRSPQVSRHDDCSNPCDAVTDRTQDARGLIDALLPGCAGTLPRRGLLLLSLTGVNVVVAAVISGRFSTSQ